MCIFRTDTGVLAYQRELEGQRILVYLNFTNRLVQTSLPEAAIPELEILLDTAGRTEFILSRLNFNLYPHEVLLLAIKPVTL